MKDMICDAATGGTMTGPRDGTMRVIEMTAPGTLASATRRIPIPVGDEVLLRTRAVTICSTDVSYYHDNLRPAVYPTVPGHEYVGEIVAVGPDQSPDLIGRRLSYFGQTDFEGLAEYRLLRPLFPGEAKAAPFRTDRHFTDDGYAAAVIVPEGVSDIAAPLLEPMTAVLRTILRHPPKVGDAVLILGGGPCGAIAGAILGRMFATARVDVLERSEARRALAERHYADSVYPSADALARARSLDAPYHYVFDALPPLPGTAETDGVRSGEESNEGDDPRRAALQAIRPEGTYVLYGASMAMQSFDTWLMLAKGVRMCSAAFDVDVYPMSLTAQVLRTALGLLEAGIVSPDWIVTQSARFDDTDGVARLFSGHEADPHLKTVVQFDD